MVMPECKCPSCGTRIDAATGMLLNANRPQPGDITVCLCCGHIMAFADDLTMRELTGEEVNEVAGNADILAMQKALREVRQ